MIDLTKTTFIIPIMIESFDRYRNTLMVLSYLNENFKTNIIIYERFNGRSSLNGIINKYNNLNIKLLLEDSKDVFHRTKYLNIMLNMVETPVVVNYDIDILLPIDSYIKSQELILNGNADIIYPFDVVNKNNYRINLINLKDYEKFLQNPKIESLKYDGVSYFYSTRGFCIFFNTDVYKNGGGENENFISWGPEDEERYYRFNTLGYKILNFENTLLYHINHIRTKDSSVKNNYFEKNKEIFNQISGFDKEKLLRYLSEQEYLSKYNFIKK